LDNKDLLELGLWNEKVKNNIIANNGSIQHMDFIPEEIRNKYRTVWELPMRELIDMRQIGGHLYAKARV
jgi:ribonucleotide reductase alpha subunit